MHAHVQLVFSKTPHESGGYPDVRHDLETGGSSPHPTHPGQRAMVISSFTGISGLIEIPITGQDIYTLAFQISLKC